MQTSSSNRSYMDLVPHKLCTLQNKIKSFHYSTSKVTTCMILLHVTLWSGLHAIGIQQQNIFQSPWQSRIKQSSAIRCTNFAMCCIFQCGKMLPLYHKPTIFPEVSLTSVTTLRTMMTLVK